MSRKIATFVPARCPHCGAPAPYQIPAVEKVRAMRLEPNEPLAFPVCAAPGCRKEYVITAADYAEAHKAA